MLNKTGHIPVIFFNKSVETNKVNQPLRGESQTTPFVRTPQNMFLKQPADAGRNGMNILLV